MAALKLYVCLCLLVLCHSRPTDEELPHSRDFYAGYIKALNDNFEVLFKPERQTRSIEDEKVIGLLSVQTSCSFFEFYLLF